MIAGLIVLSCATLFSQDIVNQPREIEEIVVTFKVPKLIHKDLFVQYDGETVYLPLVELFSLLDIHINADLPKRRFHGFFVSKDREFELDFTDFRIKISGKTYPYLVSEYILGDNDLFIRVDVYKKLFGLDMQFDFTKLQVRLSLDKDFPAYQKLQRKLAQKRLKKKRELLKDVVRLPREKAYISGAAVDWMLSSNPLGGSNQHYYYLNSGGMLLGGDLNITTAGSSSQPFDAGQFKYRWHYFFEDNRYLTQAELGEVHTGGYFGRSLKGGMVTNRPQVRRRFFQTIYLSDYIGEGWEVELYLDNKLVDYVLTDHTGVYRFTTDVFYGTSYFQLKMYGPNGEIQTEEKVYKVPFNLIPKAEFEYTVGAGTTAIRGENRRYTQANAYYGLTSSLTMGLNLDVPIAPGDDEKPLAALDGTFQLLSNLALNSSYAPNYALTGTMNFSRPDLVNIGAAYTKYFENRLRNPLNQVYNIVFSVSSPLKIGQRHLGLRYYIFLDKYPALTSVNMNYGFDLSLRHVHLTYIGRYKSSHFANRTTRTIASQLMVSTRFLRFIRPQFRVEYDHTASQLSRYGVYIAKRVFRSGQITLSYERNAVTKSDQIMFTLNLTSSFAGFTSRLLRSGEQTSINQIQRGSIRYDQGDHSLQFDYRNSVGYGVAVIRPFHDLNYNGVMDEEEDYLPGLRASMKGGRQRLDRGNGEYFYESLRPYDKYTVRIDPYSLDDPLLKPSYENYEVTINPNVVTAIEVPIVTAGEITGHVDRKVTYGKAGVGGIKIFLVNLSKETIVELTTFNNGDYYYLGLLPGSYRAYIDPGQLAKYGYVSQPEQLMFEVAPGEGGAVIEGIDFLLSAE